MAAKPKLNDDQREAFKIIQRFLNSAADTFVLQGYAGTGKTFLMQYLGKWLNEQELPFTLLASTGRAATVLRGKTGFIAKTVHSELYSFSKVDGIDDEIPIDAPIDRYAQMTLQFLLRAPDAERKLYIVDEASMLSSEPGDAMSVVSFGSGRLMIDLFDALGNNKIIFVGDPCQLPPVSQAFSPALDLNWLAGEGRTAITVTLNKIERTDADNDILVLASHVRALSQQSAWPTFPKLPARMMNNVKLYPSDKALFQSYLDKYKEVGHNLTLAIARTNETVGHINRALRRDLFGEIDLPLQESDVLLVVQNNYGVPLTNGDFAVVTSIGEARHQANLHFLSIRLKALASEQDFEILLSLDILYSKNANFSKEQQKVLMVDFNRRMQHKDIKANSDAYKKEMMSDPYLNCLRAKYGYAVTCHKAQGGEWDYVYLFLDRKMYGMRKPEIFRWWYTAITRTRRQLNLVDEWWIS